MGYHEATEKVPKHVKGSSNNCSHVVIRCHSCRHHPVESEVHHGKVHKEQVPEELQKRPLESGHGIKDGAVDKRLSKNIGEFYDDLQTLNFRA